MDDKQFTAITERLDRIMRLLAVSITKSVEKEQAKVGLLDSIGFKPGEIDRLLNKSPGYASVVLSQARKRETRPSVTLPPDSTVADKAEGT